MHANEAETLRNALEAFRKTTKIAAEVDPTYALTDDLTRRADVLIRIVWQDVELRFFAEIKNTLTPATLGAAVRQFRNANAPQPRQYAERGLLVTRHVTPQMADRLKEMDIPFIDTGGNAYINAAPVLIFIKGNKPAQAVRTQRPAHAFQPTGLRVVFALLCKPGLEKAPFREINKTANVALGTVGWVMRDLREMGCLVEMGKRGRRLARKQDLVHRWAQTYPDRLRPKLLMGRYRGPDVEWWRTAGLGDVEGYWGGETAAAMLTRYLKPRTVTIYARQPVGKLLLKYGLRKDPEGDIEILKAFWDFKFEWGHPEMVPPFIIYADLLATGDPRNIETAEMVYEREITRLVGED